MRSAVCCLLVAVQLLTPGPCWCRACDASPTGSGGPPTAVRPHVHFDRVPFAGDCRCHGKHAPRGADLPTASAETAATGECGASHDAGECPAVAYLDPGPGPSGGLRAWPAGEPHSPSHSPAWSATSHADVADGWECDSAPRPPGHAVYLVSFRLRI